MQIEKKSYFFISFLSRTLCPLRYISSLLNLSFFVAPKPLFLLFKGKRCIHTVGTCGPYAYCVYIYDGYDWQ